MLDASIRQVPDRVTDSREVDAAFSALVACGLDLRAFDPARVADALSRFPAPRHPSQDVLSGRGLGWREGRTFRLSAAPGVVALRSFDACRSERARERFEDNRRRDVDLTTGEILEHGQPVERPSRRVITEWSRKSRARMVRAFGEVDWTPVLEGPGMLGMITLTYPGHWLAVAPTGRESKRHLRLFLLRWKRCFKAPLRGGWKLEFQQPRRFGGSEGQEAPHYHIVTSVPALTPDGERFETWLSRTWADVVGAKGMDGARHRLAGTAVDFRKASRMTDPKRLAVYFLGHSTKHKDGKEYQHNVPSAWLGEGEGPGRFWGFWGMPKAVQLLDLDVWDFVAARRVLRKVARARSARVAYDRAKWQAVKAGASAYAAGVAARAAADRAPRLRSLGSGGALTGGFVIVNDGSRLTSDLARAVRLARC